MTKRRKIVLDSWPVMAYLQGETAAKPVIEIIADAHDNGDEILMSVVNAGEVWYTVARRTDPSRADEAIDLLRSLGIKFIDADWPLTKLAAAYKVKGSISYADCYAAALAKQQKAALITGDHEFKQLDDEIAITWL